MRASRPAVTTTICLSILAAALLSLFGCHRPDLHQSLSQAAYAPQKGPVLLAVYQPWFGNKEHIDVGYSSQDRVVLERQIEKAKELGIRGFVVNWYGPRKEFMDRSYGLLQDISSRQNFSIAIQYDEPVDAPGKETDSVIRDLRYAYDSYIGPNAGPSRSAYLRYNGKPLIFIFPKSGKTDWDRVRSATQAWEDPPLILYKDINTEYPNAFDGFYAWVQPGGSGWSSDGGNWGRDYLDWFYSHMSSKHPEKLAVGAAWPGFDDRRASWSRNRYMNARCGKTFEDSLRVFRRYYNESNPLPFLLIETWNDYEEGTAIERGLTKCSNDGRVQDSALASFEETSENGRSR
jgi:hypothetical protein